MAAQHLLQHGAAALSGGVNLLLSERTTTATQIAGMLTPDGRCKTLDQLADGYVRAESCVMLHLSRNAEPPSGFSASVVLQGTCVNQDGRSSSLTAPNGPAQQSVLHGALKAARLLASNVRGLELHGTGTSLGDPIEVGAAFAVLHGGAIPLRLTAAKSCYGHAEPVAGSIGMMQAALQLAMQRSKPVARLTAINPYVASTLSEFCSVGHVAPYIPRQDAAEVTVPPLSDTRAQQTMGISSFAFQGTNAHVLLASTGAFPAACHSMEGASWRRQRFWYMERQHPMLQLCNVASVDRLAMFQCQLGASSQAYLHDHQVQGRAIFPAAAMLEMALAVGRNFSGSSVQRALVGASIMAPLSLVAKQSVTLTCCLDYSCGSLVLSSLLPSTGSRMSRQHMETQAGYTPATLQLKATSMPSLQRRMFASFVMSALGALLSAVPQLFAASGGSPGKLAMALGRADGTSLLAPQQPDSYIMHPAMLDAATHTAAALQDGQGSTGHITRIPVGVQALCGAALEEPLAPNPAQQWCRGIIAGKDAFDTVLASFNVSVSSSSSLQLCGFQAKVVRSSSASEGHFAHLKAVTHAQPLRAATTEMLRQVADDFALMHVKRIVDEMLCKDVAPDMPLMEAGLDSLGTLCCRDCNTASFVSI